MKKTCKRVFALLLSFAMVLTCMPVNAFGEAGNPNGNTELPFKARVTDENLNEYILRDAEKTTTFYKWGKDDPDTLQVPLWICEVPTGTKVVKLLRNDEDFSPVSDGYESIKLIGNIYELAPKDMPQRFGEENCIVVDRGYGTDESGGRYHAICFVEKTDSVEENNIEKAVNMINNLPEINALTFADRDAVADARKLYDALLPAEKEAVTNYDKLVRAEEKIEEIRVSRYNDGTFRGVGKGFGGDIVLDVTVKDGNIFEIEVVSHKETPDLWKNVKNLMSQIVFRNDTDVDVITGATQSSKGILSATNDALKKASKQNQKEYEYLGTKIPAEVPESFTNDLWLQYDFREMNVGDETMMSPRRVEEVIDNFANNNITLPHFNYEVIKGDSVQLDTSDNAHLKVKAVKPGNTVVKISYDKITIKDKRGFETVHPACDPVNTAYVVYSVGGNKDIQVSDNIVYDSKEAVNGKKVLRSYDTLYFAEGETVPFEINVSQKGAEKLEVLCNGLPVEGNNGKYVLPLENRSNIIEMTATAEDGSSRSLFRVIDARRIKVNVENKSNPGEPLRKGEVAHISFTGITMPVYKLATIYNPYQNFGWDDGGEVTHVHYEKDGKIYKGKCNQYDLDKVNSFDVKMNEPGKNTFENGKIKCGWYGSPLGTDKGMDDKGQPNFNAPVMQDFFSVMPDFTVEVLDEIPVKTVTLDKTELSMIKDEKVSLTAKIMPEDATEKNTSWTSADENVAKVNGEGQVTAVGKGTTEITATAGGKKAVCRVTVKNPVIEKITIDEKTEIFEAESRDLAVKYSPENIVKEDKNIIWTTSNKTIVTVDRNGKITGHKAGNAIVTAVSKANGRVKAECTVTVKKLEVESVTLDKKELTTAVGSSAVLKAEVLPAGVSDISKPVWKSSDESVVKVSADGMIVPLKEGKADVTVTIKDKEATCRVTVKKGNTGEVTATVKEEKILMPGEKFTVTFNGMDIPAEKREFKDNYVTYKSTCGEMVSEKISAEELFKDNSNMTFTFTVPENAQDGTHFMTSGEFKAETSFFIPGRGPVFSQWSKYKDEMPVIEFTVGKEKKEEGTVVENNNGSVVIKNTDATKAEVQISDIRNITGSLTVMLADNEKVVYDKKAVEKMIKQLPEDAVKIEFILENSSFYNDELSEMQLASLDKNKDKAYGLYELSVRVTKADGEQIFITDFEDGNVSVTVDFRNPDNAALEVLRLDKDGTFKWVKSSYADGRLTWETDSHSFYMIAEEGKTKGEVERPVSNETPDSGVTPGATPGGNNAGHTVHNTQSEGVPQTGDATDIMLWILILSGAAMALICVKKQNR